MQVIAISGKAQHGKDTTAGFLKQMLEEDGHSVLIAHYGDLVKYVCRTFFKWNGEKDEYGRGLLQRVGTNEIRAKDHNFWVSFIVSILRFFPDEWDYVLIPDCRFPNEVEYLAQAGIDTIHLRVIRSNFISPLTKEQQEHPSETALDDSVPDYYIKNDGSLDELKMKISDLVTEFIGFHQMTIDELKNN